MLPLVVFTSTSPAVAVTRISPEMELACTRVPIGTCSSYLASPCRRRREIERMKMRPDVRVVSRSPSSMRATTRASGRVQPVTMMSPEMSDRSTHAPLLKANVVSTLVRMAVCAHATVGGNPSAAASSAAHRIGVERRMRVMLGASEVPGDQLRGGRVARLRISCSFAS